MKQVCLLALLAWAFLTGRAQTQEYDPAPLDELPVQHLSLDSYTDNFGYGGLTLGVPGIVNVNVGGFAGPLGIGFSFSALHVVEWMIKDKLDENGVSIADQDDDFMFVGQLNADIKLFASDNLLLAGTGAVGTIFRADTTNPNNDIGFVYYGTGGHLFYKSFFLEGGWAWGRELGEDKKPQLTQFPLFQIGFVGRF